MLSRQEIDELLRDDPIECARSLGLTYRLPEEGAMVTRHRWGRGFTYRRADQTLEKGSALRQRISALPIPPAWTDVCIAASPKNHVLATGRDDAGRKQYLYHPEFRELREATKFRRIAGFGALLPSLRRRIEKAIKSKENLSRERVLATCLHLLDVTLCRVGDRSYTKQNGSYGLTTLRKRHVTLAKNQSRATLSFLGKSGQKRRIVIDDPVAAKLLAECLDVPGYELFQYFDEEGNKIDVSAEELNEYLRELADAPVSAKDFRTWAGTVFAAMALEQIVGAQPDTARERQVLQAVDEVAKRLGNTPAVCRSSYIAPQILSAYPDEALSPKRISAVLGRGKAIRQYTSATEAAVLVFLLNHLQNEQELEAA